MSAWKHYGYIKVDAHRQVVMVMVMVMTSCHSNVKEYAGAMLVQVMQIRAGL